MFSAFNGWVAILFVVAGQHAKTLKTQFLVFLTGGWRFCSLELAMTLKKQNYVFEGVDVWVAVLFLGAGQHPKNTHNVVLNIFDGWDVPSRHFKRLRKPVDIPERRFKSLRKTLDVPKRCSKSRMKP